MEISHSFLFYHYENVETVKSFCSFYKTITFNQNNL